MNVSDGTLVLGVRNGDHSAFAELYDRRARLIRAICLDETRDLDAAADLTQETFLRAYRNLADLRDPQRFAAWLTGIARQVCREYRRGRFRERRRIEQYAALMTADPPGAAPPDLEPADDRLLRLRAAVGGWTTPAAAGSPAGLLTEQQRLALHAFYLQGRNAEEARSVLGLSRSSFYRVLASACERLRALLTRQEVQP